MTHAPEVPLRMQVITERDIRSSIKRARRSLEKAAEEIVWQIEIKAWLSLGYENWNEMREAEYGGAAVMVPTGSRARITARLKEIEVGKTARGKPKRLTDKQIADTLGVARDTVQSDLNGGNKVSEIRQNAVPDSTPVEPTDVIIDAELVEDDGPIHVNRNTGEILNTPNTTTGTAPAEPATTTCPTCHGTGKVTP